MLRQVIITIHLIGTIGFAAAVGLFFVVERASQADRCVQIGGLSFVAVLVSRLALAVVDEEGLDALRQFCQMVNFASVVITMGGVVLIAFYMLWDWGVGADTMNCMAISTIGVAAMLVSRLALMVIDECL